MTIRGNVKLHADRSYIMLFYLEKKWGDFVIKFVIKVLSAYTAYLFTILYLFLNLIITLCSLQLRPFLSTEIHGIKIHAAVKFKKLTAFFENLISNCYVFNILSLFSILQLMQIFQEVYIKKSHIDII